MLDDISELATRVLKVLEGYRAMKLESRVTGEMLEKALHADRDDINDCVALLKGAGYVETMLTLSEPFYSFSWVWITALGRQELKRIAKTAATVIVKETADHQSSASLNEPTSFAMLRASSAAVSIPPTPVGSPYGFNDDDWEYIASAKSQSGLLTVVLGFQFNSTHYDSAKLVENIELWFVTAVSDYNRQPGAIKTALNFRALGAGYGEHLFNEIARDIIAADIAVFETSDLNPNVMLEMGVALTWGTRVLPITVSSRPRPPSDVSGQTWAEHSDSGGTFADPGHQAKLVRMVERAVRKKIRN